MFAGYHPFDTVMDVKKNPPRDLPGWVPPDVKELILNLLDKDPRKRKSIDEIKRWLFLRKEPPKAALYWEYWEVPTLKAQIAEL